MKANRAFLILIVALMALMILFEINAPTRYKWDDFSHSYKSKQPFGCYVMDSVLRASLPQDYEVLGGGIVKYTDKSYKGNKHTFLFTNNFEDFIYSLDINIFQLLRDGNNVVIASDEYHGYSGDDVCKELGFRSDRVNYFDQRQFKNILSDSARYDTVRWVADGRFAAASYLVNRVFCVGYLDELDPTYSTLATLGISDYYSDNNITVAGIRDYGKGKLLVVTMPLIFSNYGILDDALRPLALRLLSECGDKPVVRYDPSHIDQVVVDEQVSESPLRYLLANRPLRWAFYLALATIVALLLFSARRRQRVIPVIKPPVNHMMDFVKRIGGIYYKRHDNVDLLNKKYVTFSNELRSRAMIDIDNDDNIDDELQMLSNRIGVPLNELRQQVRDLKDAAKAFSISDKRLQQLIDLMNDMMHRINI